MADKVTSGSKTDGKRLESTSSEVSSDSSRQPKSQMESMNKEELLLHAKKQLILLQKVKSRCDEIGLKNGALEANLRSKESELDEIKSKYEFNETEISKIRERFSIMESQNTILTRKVADLEEQLECTQLKQKTAEATFSCLSDDMTKLHTENKELRNEVSVLKTAREDAVLSLKTLKDTLNAQHTLEMAETTQKMQSENEQLENVVRSLREELMTCKQQINEIDTEKEAFLEEIANQNSVLEQLRTELSDSERRAIDFEAIAIESKETKAKNDSLEVEMSFLSELCERRRQELTEFASKDEMFRVERLEFDNLKAEYGKLKSEDVEKGIIFEDLRIECERLRKELSDVRAENVALKNGEDFMNAEIRDLKTRVEMFEEAKKLLEMEYETAKAKFAGHDAEYRRAREEIEVTIRENENLRQQLSACGSIEEKHDDSHKEAFKCLQMDYDKLKIDFNELSLRDEVSAREKEEFLEELMDTKEQLSALQLQYNLTRDELEEAKYKDALLEAEQSAVQLLQRECECLRNELAEQRSRESFLEAERDALLSSQQESDAGKIEGEDQRFRSLQAECDGLRQELEVLQARESILEAEKNVLMSSLQECDLKRHELEEKRCKGDLLMIDRLQDVTLQNEEHGKQFQLATERALHLASTLSSCSNTIETNERNVADILQKCIEEVANWKEKERNEVKTLFESVAKVESENVELEETLRSLTETLNGLDTKVTSLEDADAVTVQTVVGTCQTDVIGQTAFGIELRDVSTDCDIVIEKSQNTVESQSDKCYDCERLENLLHGKLNQFTASIRMMRSEIVSIASKLKDVVKLLKDCGYEDSGLIETLDNLEKLISVADNTKDEDIDGVNKTIGDLQKLSNVISSLPDVLRKRISSYNSMPVSTSKEKSSALKEAEDMVSKYKIIAVKAKKESAEIRKKLDALNSELSTATKEKLALEENVRSVGSQLNEERQKHKATMSKLEQHSNLISLEIADYERHASDLSKQLAEKDALVNTLETDVSAQMEKIHGLQVQIGQLESQYQQSEERGEQLKSVSVKLRKDIADLQKDEAELKVREGSLLARLESASQEIENYKVQLSDVSAANQKLQSTNHSMQEAHQKVVRLLEARISSLTEEIAKIRSEYETCLSEYESYKVRVHSVLKQQKSKSPTETPSSLEMSHEEKVQMEKAIETLQTRIQELSARHVAVETENETLQEVHFNLLQRHNKMASNLAEQESSWRQRLEKLQSELKLEQQEHSELMRQIQLQDETHELAAKKKIDALLEVHRTEVERLQERLGMIEAQNLKLQREVAQSEMTRNTYRDDEQVVDILNMERQEGEGSEFTDSQKLGLSSSITSFMPLEQLLSQDERTSISSINTIETEKLESQLVISTKKIDHLTEILHESEATNARMTEQNRVLKEEIRRLERNQEREKHMANMEYLKNVIVKFISLSGGDEREHLVPVLTTLLKLSPSEEQQITTIARGAVESSANAVGGWSSYLPMPRWSGTF